MPSINREKPMSITNLDEILYVHASCQGVNYSD